MWKKSETIDLKQVADYMVKDKGIDFIVSELVPFKDAKNLQTSEV